MKVNPVLLRRILPFLLWYFPLSSRAQSELPQTVLTISAQNTSLIDVIGKIRSQTGTIFVYNKELLQAQPVISLSAKNAPLSKILESVESQSNIHFQQIDGMVVVVAKSPGKSHELILEKNSPQASSIQEISAQIVNEAGQALDGVSIENLNRLSGTISDSSGSFQLEARKGDQVRLTHISYQPAIIKVEESGKSLGKIRMVTRAAPAEEIVVSGYQRLEKKMSVGMIAAPELKKFLLPGKSTIDGMLQGKIAGLTLSNTSGSISASPSIVIRGISTFTGNRQPIWVVDGVVQEEPFSQSQLFATAEGSLKSLQGNAVSGLNPKDIESISFLKDATASAIYGVQGANGVIVIATKKGTPSKKPSFGFSHSFGFTTRPRQKHYQGMTGAERLEASVRGYDSGYPLPLYYPEDSYEFWLSKFRNHEIDRTELEKQAQALSRRNTDWMKTLFRPGLQRLDHIQLSGGTPAIQYYTSFGWDHLSGAAIGESMERYTGNLRLTAQPSPGLRLDAGLHTSTRRVKGFFTTNPFDYAWSASPLMDPSVSYPANHNTFHNALEKPYKQYLPYNFKEELNETGAINNNLQWQARVHSNWKWNRNWEWSSLLAYSYRKDQSREWASAKSWYARQQMASGIIATDALEWKDERSSRSGTVRQNFYYNKPLFQKDQLSVMAGSELRTGNNLNENAVILSGYTNLAYNHGNRFVLNSSVRKDASNQFSNAQKQLTTYSLGGRWNLDAEPFMMRQSLISKLDLRVITGLQGSLSPASYGMLRVSIPEESIDPVTGEQQLVLAGLPNSNLHWEKTKSTSVGIDLGLWNDRFKLSVDAYRKKGKELMLQEYIAYEYGLPTLLQNRGHILNQGIEATIDLVPVSTKNWYWSVDFNLAANQNRALTTAANGHEGIMLLSDFVNGREVVAGKPVGAIFVPQFSGLNPENGLPLFAGQHASGDSDPMHWLVYQGAQQPWLTGGFETQVRHKNITLQAGFAMASGQVARLAPLYPDAGDLAASPLPQQNLRDEQIHSWQKPGDHFMTQTPSINTPEGTGQQTVLPGGLKLNAYALYDLSSARVAPAWFLRCTNLILEYRLPANYLSRLGLQQTELTVSGNNLWVVTDQRLSGADPETGNFGSVSQPILPSFFLGFTTRF